MKSCKPEEQVNDLYFSDITERIAKDIRFRQRRLLLAETLIICLFIFTGILAFDPQGGEYAGYYGIFLSLYGFLFVIAHIRWIK